jgi:hypothetical protein
VERAAESPEVSGGHRNDKAFAGERRANSDASFVELVGRRGLA